MTDELRKELSRKAHGVATANHVMPADTLYGRALARLMELEIELADERRQNERLRAERLKLR